MHRSARHETLQGIYGAPQPAPQSAKVVRRPTTRPASSASTRNAVRKSWIKQPTVDRRVEDDEALPSERNIEKEKDSQGRSYGGDKSIEEVELVHPVEPEHPAVEKEKPEIESRTVAPTSPQLNPHKPKYNPLVLSFYGDGFLEVRQKQESGQLLIRKELGIGSFKVELLVFKAADVAKPALIV